MIFVLLDREVKGLMTNVVTVDYSQDLLEEYLAIVGLVYKYIEKMTSFLD